MPDSKQKKVTIDLKGRSLGRAASDVAVVLRGKNKADFSPQKTSGVTVEVKNVELLKMSEKKLSQKEYVRHTGYPGGLRKTGLGELWANSPEEVFKCTVKGMLPKNKLQKVFLKNLKFVK